MAEVKGFVPAPHQSLAEASCLNLHPMPTPENNFPVPPGAASKLAPDEHILSGGNEYINPIRKTLKNAVGLMLRQEDSKAYLEHLAIGALMSFLHANKAIVGTKDMAVLQRFSKGKSRLRTLQSKRA